MKRKIMIIFFACTAGYLPLLASGSPSDGIKPSNTNTTTIMASFVLSPGRYTSSLSPNINREMGARIEKSLGGVPGIEKVTADQEDSSIHFTIMADAHVRISDVQQGVAKADHGVVISVPVLENSQSAQLGL